jgi:hypothetical protein
MLSRQAQDRWDTFVGLLDEVDDEVARWYGFSADQVVAIAQGLPWARRSGPALFRNTDSATAPLMSGTGIDNGPASGMTNRIPVASSHIYAIGYDPVTQTLEVEFHSGQVVQYQDVPEAVYTALQQAPSKGIYYMQQIRGRYNRPQG